MDEDDEEAALRALPLSELRKRCKELHVDTAPLLEKIEYVRAILEAQADAEEAEAAAEEEALRQALLMSEETEETLAALPISELRSRCQLRNISTVGLAERADLVAALLGAAMDLSDDVPTAVSSAPAARVRGRPGWWAGGDRREAASWFGWVGSQCGRGE